MTVDVEADDTKLKDKVKDLPVLWHFFKAHRSEAWGVGVVMVVASFLESLNIVAIYPIINYGLKLQGQSKPLQWMNDAIGMLPFKNTFISACVFLIILTIVATAIKILYQHMSNKFTMTIVAETQNDIFNKLATASYAHFVKNQQGKMIYAASIAPTGIATSVYYVIRIIQSALTTLFLVTAMTFLAWQGMAFMVALGVIYVFFIRKILNHFVNRYSHLSVHEDEAKNVILNEFITGIKSIKAFHAERDWQNKFENVVQRSVDFRFKVLFGHVLPDSFLKFVFLSGIGLAGILLGVFYQGEFVTLLPLIGTFAIVATRLIPYINMLGNDTVAIARYMPDVKIVYNFLNETIVEPSAGEKIVSDFTSGIHFENIWFKYEGMEDFLFTGLDFTIKKNKMTAIVGLSGSGKSSIVNLLLGLYRPNRGEIKFDEVNINEFKREQYLGQIGYVSQETFIFNGTIKENILFGAKEYSELNVIEAAKLANAHDFILNTEKGYDTVVGDAGAKLSGGQRQRIAIARAMLRKPKILLMDEATSSLDTVSERQVQEAIGNVIGRTTIIIIAHRLSTVQNADKIIVLEHGKIVEQGTHDELSRNGKAYSVLYKNMSYPVER
jgi:ABC-type multidrug transport system fused ATPase/permease subunit